MKKVMIIVLCVLLLQISPIVNAESDCEYFVLPKLGANAYTQCLQNPTAYSEYFVYHTVKFYNGGILLKTESVRDGDSATAPSDPYNSGYVFNGWNTSFSNISSDLNVYARFTQTAYTLTYKDYNGTTLKQETVSGGEDGNPPSVSRTGYTFTGWSDSYRDVNENRTLFARYSIKTYTVRFFDNNSNLLKTESVNHGSSATPPAAPTVSGMSFTGWNQSYTGVTSSKDIYALYESDDFTVTFRADDVLKVEYVSYGESATAPIASKEGHTFTGWDKSFINITEDTTVQALFAINSYTVSFHDDGGNLLHTEEVEYMNSATPPTFSKIGYTFLGWDGNYSNIKDNIVLNPILEVTTFKVKMIDYDGTVFLEEDVEYGGVCSTITPNREGYRFAGFSEDCQYITENKTVTLVYEPLVYTVRFMTDSTLIKEELVNYGGCANEPDVEKEGHTFTGWDHDICNIHSDLEINAVFDSEEYTATFLNYDGTVLGTRVVTYGGSASFPEPKRDGYHFTGWSDSLIIKGNITLMAKYALNKYTVIFKYQNEVLHEESVTHGSSVVAPTFKREGVKFLEWDQSFDYVTDNLVVIAVTEKEQYKITFKDYNMNTLSEQYIYYQEDAIPPIPSRTGYTFVGWSDGFESIKADNTLIAQYEGVLVEVKYIFNDEVVNIQKITYGSIPPQINGYHFDEVVVFSDREIDLTEVCMNTFFLDSEIVLPCGEVPDDPIKEGFVFIEWQLNNDVYEAIFEEESHTVTFIVGDYMETAKVKRGELPKVSEYLLNKDVDWDQEFLSVIDEVTYTGYIDPIDKPTLNVEIAEGVYLFDFSIDVSKFDLMYIVIDGELKTMDDYYIEKDETNFFDRKSDWFKLYTDEEVEKVYFSDGTEYRYTVQEHYAESNLMKRILSWVESIFS